VRLHRSQATECLLRWQVCGKLTGMNAIALIAASLAALLHLVFFYMESIGFMQPKIYKRFFVKDDAEARTVKIWAYNQGFYNLFLAIITIAGVIAFSSHESVGRALVVAACGAMFGAGLALVSSDSAAARPALVQALFPAIALLTIW